MFSKKTIKQVNIKIHVSDKKNRFPALVIIILYKMCQESVENLNKKTKI